jgi:hypothetical protein
MATATIYDNDPITQKLNGLTDDLKKSDTTTGQILTSERDMLLEKQRTIIDAKFGQNRIIDLNRNQMKRNAAYTKVGIFAVIALGIVLLLRLFGGFIPDAILSLIYILLISMAVFYGLMVYVDVSGRESTNYDRYDIPPPFKDISETNNKNAQNAAIKAGNLLAANDTKVCAGQSCCNYDQAYDNSQLVNKCVKCAEKDGKSTYFVKASNGCDLCPAGTNYIRDTQSCASCASGTNYIQSTQSCGTCLSGKQYNASTKECA